MLGKTQGFRRQVRQRDVAVISLVESKGWSTGCNMSSDTALINDTALNPLFRTQGLGHYVP